MNYIGSKNSLLSFIQTAVDSCDLKKNNPVLCDIFAGTGRVGRFFKTKGFQIVSNDMEYYSYSLIKHYIGNHKQIEIKPFLNELNSLNGINTGFVYNYYCPSGKNSQISRKINNKMEYDTRKYFSDENGMIIDEARQKINEWKEKNEINEAQYDYLLASILEASDKVANTASVYGAFLKKIKKTALKRIQFLELEYEITEYSHYCFNENANDLIKKISGDILYMDPPYNERQYGANYHVLNTIAKYDNPTLKGVTGMREYNQSLWCKKNEVKKEFENIIKDANFKYILLSYNSESLMSKDDIRSIMEKFGDYSVFEKKYQRFKADKEHEDRNYSADFVIEYVHVLKK